MISAPVNGFVIHYLQTEDLFLVIGGGTEIGEDFITSDVGFRTVDNEGSTISSVRSEMVRERYNYPWETRTGIAWAPMPFTVKPFARFVSDGSVLIVAGSEPVVRWYRTDGTLRKKITLDLPAMPISQKNLDEHFQDLEDQMVVSDNPRQRERLRRMRQEVKLPENRSYWAFVTIDDQGYIWLEVLELESERQRDGGVLYHLLSPDGEYLGNSRAPAAGRAVNGYFLGKVTDPENDRVDYQVWRMHSSAESFIYP
jgi:hypothetical protein